ncbi:MAG: DNA mismatch repair protein MutS [Defluviitaleaceae bacterium]|nr:DNA mismatch repair protein MutS [Defluviitaleaceae bacterium]
MSQLTPMMLQYLEIKEKYKDCILFYRLGDFYEMFFEDALTASAELDIVLTGRECGMDEKAPMCGVPFHSADSYIAKLVKKGYKVAICEQMEKPGVGGSKAPVRREVVRVVTPGTIIDNNYLEIGKNNYIFCAYECEEGFGLSVCDISTGEFTTTSFSLLDTTRVIDEAAKFMPAEIIAREGFSLSEALVSVTGTKISFYDPWGFEYANAFKALCDHFGVINLSGFGIEDNIPSIGACGALISYLHQTQMNGIAHINSIRYYTNESFMPLDISSRRNLEISETMRGGSKKGSLLGVLDKTTTSIGARLLKSWMEQPLIDAVEINKRLDLVGELKDNPFYREEIKAYLNNIYDMERLLSKTVYKSVNPKDLIALKKSFESLPSIKLLLVQLKSDYGSELYNNLDSLEDLHHLINKGIMEDPPFSVREGGFIKSGLNTELDRLREVKDKADQWLRDFEMRQRADSGIKNLKIKYNKVFGYYMEVTNSYTDKVPDTYIRRQTLANAERYTNEELKKIEDEILNADGKIVDLEYNLFMEIIAEIEGNAQRIQKSSGVIAALDSLLSLAEAAHINNYTRPEITNDGAMHIKNGRHPVVERMLKDTFVPNDTRMDLGKNRMAIITGPNMAGKSTYMRQVALITLMAQCGSFVPADSAIISICDRIFTRVGAADDLATGQSTFMVEMSEVANILNYATKNSLLILDEIGRGTSTYDGLSIAWAVLEYIADINKLGAKTLFATHYHELTELEGNVDGVVNYRVSVSDYNGDIVFLRKIERGGADRSYGIHVARLAGLPHEVLYRSEEVMMLLLHEDMIRKSGTEDEDNSEAVYYERSKKKTKAPRRGKGDLIIDEILALNIDAMSPREALQTLYDFQEKSKDT